MYPDDVASKRNLIQSYLEGLTWVLTYYHHGCGSWNWFYPHLYAPLASDLRNLSTYEIRYAEGRPFTPLLQLLAVLPPQSSSFLPKSYRDLMLDPNSPLATYYPVDFSVDTNGKRNAWESIVKIPFIHEESLLTVINKINHTSILTPAERLRNLRGEEYVVTRFKQPLPN
jgi:5'-3' exonuclease